MLVSDPDRARRNLFVTQASQSLAPFDDLRGGHIDAGNTSIVWRASEHAPVSTFGDDDRTSVLWGDAIPANGFRRADAQAIANGWRVEREVFDGFYAACLVGSDGRIRVGGDLLGYFPIYYAAVGDVLLVAASPEVIARHPLVTPSVSREGLLAVMMVCGPFDGACLVAGVRRLSAGRMLEWRPGERPRELDHYTLPTTQHLAGLSDDDQGDALFDAMTRMVRRHHAPGERAGLLLSGGRDSRLIAGCLHEQGTSVDALTVGIPSDHEVEIASVVANTLGFTHHVDEAPYDEFAEYALRSARWEHLSAGMGTIDTWGYVRPSRSLPARSANGYSRGRDVELMPRDFAAVIRRVTKRGIQPDVLKAMVKDDESREIVDDLVQRLRVAYDAMPGDDRAEAGFHLSMATYHRFYIGGIPWRLSFGSWPVMAVLDRDFLSTWIGIPIAQLADRGIIETLLARRLPRLARLPLDRNAPVTRPIAPSLAYRAREELSYRLPWMEKRDDDAGVERRQYFRKYDFANPGWRAIRYAAEPNRAALAEWFDLAAVDHLLPSPDVPAPVDDPMSQGFERKALLGLMLWIGDH